MENIQSIPKNKWNSIQCKKTKGSGLLEYWYIPISYCNPLASPSKSQLNNIYKPFCIL